MKNTFIILLFYLLYINTFAQAHYESYWQQETKYTIEASIDTETDILSGHQHLIYYNNSPHELQKLYFHLYQNAFTPGSYLDNKQQNSAQPIPFGHYESEGKGIEVNNIRINGQAAVSRLDNTILEIILPKPLPSGDSLIIEMDFKTYFDLSASWRRMRVYKAYGVKNYNGGHWYPRISVFDRKFGWTADQHMVHEFYGDFGTYDVSLKLPEHYIVDATGLLQNREQAMPEELRKKLDISNFKDKPLFSAPSEVIPVSEKMKTWHFKADKVHDFAFVASPLFRIGEVNWNGIICRSLAMEPHAARWQDAARLTADIIKLFSTDFGMYAYPKMIVADVQSGMEYPMLTMNSGLSPDYAYIFSHEIGHNWFFGAVATNETYRGALDEGFTQFLTAWALEKLALERTISSPPSKTFPDKFRKQNDLRYRTIFYRYYEDAFYEEGTRVNQHSDKFLTDELYGTVYRQTYYKTGSMLYNLQFVLGDSLFKSCVKHYYDTWKFRHPYTEDMRKAFINHSGVELNWFFDQWLNTKKTIDYAVSGVSKSGKGKYNITLQRKGRMEMPLDVMVIFKNGDSTIYHIPNRSFVKQTNAIVLPKWFGWDKLHPEYTFTIASKSKINDVIIDPENRISDMNRMNNTWKCNSTYSFDWLITQPENPYRYEYYLRPSLWWNETDGLKAGIHISGSYMKELHKLEARILYNTNLLPTNEQSSDIPLSWHLKYSTRISRAPAKTFISFNSIQDLDWNFNRVAVQLRSPNKKHNYSISLNSSQMFSQRNLDYKANQQNWSSYSKQKPYLFLKAQYKRPITNGELWFNMIAGLGELSANRLEFCIRKTFQLGKLDLRSRGFIQYGLEQFTAEEDKLLLSGANSLERIRNRIVRSPGIIPSGWTNYSDVPGHFHYSGGLNIRGYSSYLSAITNESGKVEYQHYGNTGMAVNAELSTQRLFQAMPRKLRKYLGLDIYSFFDAGVLDQGSITKLPTFDRIYFDAGAGVALDIHQWWKFDKIAPMRLRFDMPLFLNVKPYGQDKNFMFRWMLGLEKSL